MTVLCGAAFENVKYRASRPVGLPACSVAPVTDGHWIWTPASGDNEAMNLAAGIAQVDASGQVQNTWDVGNVGYDVAVGDDGGVWFLGPEGLEWLNPSTGEVQAWKAAEDGETPIFVVAGSDGVWVGTYEGPVYFRAFD